MFTYGTWLWCKESVKCMKLLLLHHHNKLHCMLQCAEHVNTMSIYVSIHAMELSIKVFNKEGTHHIREVDTILRGHTYMKRWKTQIRNTNTNTNTKHKDKHKCSWHKSESKGAHPHEAIKVVAQPALEISLWNHHGTVAGPLAPIVKCICLYFKIIWAKVQSVFDQSCICPNFQINLLKKIIAKPRHPCRCTGQSGTGIIIGGLGKVRRALLIYSYIFFIHPLLHILTCTLLFTSVPGYIELWLILQSRFQQIHLHLHIYTSWSPPVQPNHPSLPLWGQCEATVRLQKQSESCFDFLRLKRPLMTFVGGHAWKQSDGYIIRVLGGKKCTQLTLPSQYKMIIYYREIKEYKNRKLMSLPWDHYFPARIYNSMLSLIRYSRFTKQGPQIAFLVPGINV